MVVGGGAAVTDGHDAAQVRDRVEEAGRDIGLAFLQLKSRRTA